MNKPILLDTHIWIWLILNHNSLNDNEIINLINNAKNKNRLYLSAISIWETGMLIKKNRINVHQEPLQWINQAISKSGIIILPLHPEIAINSSILKEIFHGDPADRIIMASTIFLKSTLISADKKIIRFCQLNNLNHIQI